MPYYPLNKIFPNLFTSGNQFVLSTSGKDYKGFYYSTYDGKYFTGKTVDPSSEELISVTSAQKSTLSLGTKSYDELSNSKQPSVIPISAISIPTPEDYKNGYYYRYFTKRVNGDLSTIQEVSKDTYDKVSPNPLYNRIQVQWFLSGPIEDTYISGMLVLGVSNHNIKTVTQAVRQMQYLDQYLTNPIQYYKK